MSTIRFRDLVKTAGTPEPKSLWTDPKQDRQFMHAVKQNRVLTVVPGSSASKKDFGELGFHQHQHALYFVFPKPLPESEGKVIGIKYDLVESRDPKDALSAEDLQVTRHRHAKSTRKEKSEPRTKTFRVLVRRVATLETDIPVEARTKKEAAEKGIEIAKAQDFALAKAKIENEVRVMK